MNNDGSIAAIGKEEEKEAVENFNGTLTKAFNRAKNSHQSTAREGSAEMIGEEMRTARRVSDLEGFGHSLALLGGLPGSDRVAKEDGVEGEREKDSRVPPGIMPFYDPASTPLHR